MTRTTIQRAIKTLLDTGATGIDLDVTPHDFPDWADQIALLGTYPHLSIQLQEPEGHWLLGISVITDHTRRHWYVSTHIDTPPPDANLQVTPNGITHAVLTRTQLDYLTQKAG